MTAKRALPWLVLFIGLPLAYVAGRAQVGHAPRARLERLWPAPAFSYPADDGTLVSLASLKGKAWVANFVFTQCRTICPSLTAKMAQLQRQLEGLDVRFVSFSVDPAHDTPQVLATYRSQWRPQESRWRLLATDAASLPALARDFHIVAEANRAPDALDPIMHSATFLLVDADGIVRGHYDSEDPNAFASLALDLRALAPEAPLLATLPEDGAALYAALSCDVCHAQRALAPDLRGLAGTRRPLTHAQSAQFDAAYVRESILQPAAKRVDGYPLRMPSYAGQLDDARLATLVEWILARPADSAPAPAPVAIHSDPVCGMDVRADADAISATHDGGTFYFCSERCKERFVHSASAHSGK